MCDWNQRQCMQQVHMKTIRHCVFEKQTQFYRNYWTLTQCNPYHTHVLLHMLNAYAVSFPRLLFYYFSIPITSSSVTRWVSEMFISVGSITRETRTNGTNSIFIPLLSKTLSNERVVGFKKKTVCVCAITVLRTMRVCRENLGGK